MDDRPEQNVSIGIDQGDRFAILDALPAFAQPPGR